MPQSPFVRSILWFCRLRWFVTGVLAAFGLVGLFPQALPRIGLRPHPQWPFSAALVLAAANMFFVAHARHLARSAEARGAKANLWAQILVDLTVLAVVVHYMGSLETYVAFAYLFHIVLACIFFPRPWSLGVTAIASVLYVACVMLEEARVVPLVGIYGDWTLRRQMERMPGFPILNVTWAVATWIVVWYLASQLSAMVRERDKELAETNRLLVEAQAERTRHMVRTTHELKAPFAAIDANAQLLLKGHCGALPDKAQTVVKQITARCRRLARQIQDMLQMTNLQAAGSESLHWVRLDLAEVLRWCAAQLEAVAKERGVALEEDLQPARVLAVEDQMKMLFSNLLSNAVSYSYRGGRVAVRCVPAEDEGAVVSIEDHGIGIPAEEQAKVFDEFHRGSNVAGTGPTGFGLGLAIVKELVDRYNGRISLESEVGVGTTVCVELPTVAQGQPGHHSS